MNEEGEAYEGQNADSGIGLGAKDAVQAECGGEAVKGGGGKEDAAVAEVDVFEHGAELAFHGSDVCGRGGVVSLVSTLLPMVHAVGEEFNKGGVGIKAGDLFVGFAAGFEEGLASFDGDFLKGFEAVGGKGGADDFDVFVTVFSELLEGHICVRLEPGGAPKA